MSKLKVMWYTDCFGVYAVQKQTDVQWCTFELWQEKSEYI
jgi:hypothetical protein